jgi:formylglycine-generating enzyme
VLPRGHLTPSALLGRAARIVVASLLTIAAWSCAEPCPDGYAQAQDQCVKSAAGEPHRCAVLPKTKDDPSGPGVLARVDVPGGSCFWIEQTEVTVDEYAGWLSDVPDGAVQWETAWCKWKKERSRPLDRAADGCAADIPSFDTQAFGPRKPVRCVDFCDAEAFCAYAGKRLCYGGGSRGVQGPRGVPKEWLLACTNGFTTVYPWGNLPDGNDCNVNSGEQVPYEVGRQAQCQSPSGVADLLGNVAEWTLSCSFVQPGQQDVPTSCLVHGGAFDQPLEACAAETNLPNDTRRIDIGFRCCEDLTDAESRLITQSSGTGGAGGTTTAP